MEIEECPTRDNIIACSECPYECKLRMEPKKECNEAQIPPESVPSVIYY